MGPKRSWFCNFKGCKNNNAMKGLHFFRFPRNETRCEAWVKIAQNEKLFGLPASRLNLSHALCSDHFQDWCFMNIKSMSRLVHNAIPASPKPVPPPRDSTLLCQMSEEVEDKEKIGESEDLIPTVSPAVNTSVYSRVNPPVSQPVKKQRVTIFPIISKVGALSNKRLSEDDEELELYLKLTAKKLKRYMGFERHQIMHEIDSVFLRYPPSSGSS